MSAADTRPFLAIRGRRGCLDRGGDPIAERGFGLRPCLLPSENEFDTLARFYPLAFPGLSKAISGSAFEIDEFESVIPDAEPDKDWTIV